MIHSQTVNADLLEVARKLCEIPELTEFRIVGGTAVALHFGHRISVDIDFFTGEKTNKKQISSLLMNKFPGCEAYVTQYGIRSEIQGVKVELFDDLKLTLAKCFLPLLQAHFNVTAYNGEG